MRPYGNLLVLVGLYRSLKVLTRPNNLLWVLLCAYGSLSYGFLLVFIGPSRSL